MDFGDYSINELSLQDSFYCSDEGIVSIEDIYESIDSIAEGIDMGADLGLIYCGLPGAIVGSFLGGFIGCVKELKEEAFGLEIIY